MIALTIPEAESKLDELVELVERSAEPVFLLRLGQIVARIVPMKGLPRDVSPDPHLGNIEIKGDLFADSSTDWESA